MSISTEINNGLSIPLVCYLFIILIFRIYYKHKKILARNDDWAQARFGKSGISH